MPGLRASRYYGVLSSEVGQQIGIDLPLTSDAIGRGVRFIAGGSALERGIVRLIGGRAHSAPATDGASETLRWHANGAWVASCPNFAFVPSAVDDGSPGGMDRFFRAMLLVNVGAEGVRPGRGELAIEVRPFDVALAPARFTFDLTVAITSAPREHVHRVAQMCSEMTLVQRLSLAAAIADLALYEHGALAAGDEHRPVDMLRTEVDDVWRALGGATDDFVPAVPRQPWDPPGSSDEWTYEDDDDLDAPMPGAPYHAGMQLERVVGSLIACTIAPSDDNSSPLYYADPGTIAEIAMGAFELAAIAVCIERGERVDGSKLELVHDAPEITALIERQRAMIAFVREADARVLVDRSWVERYSISKRT